MFEIHLLVLGHPNSGPDMSQIFTTYLDLMDPTPRRKECLEKHYYFTCQCPRCSNWDKLEADMFTIMCNSCKENDEISENSQGFACYALEITILSISHTCPMISFF